MLPDYMARSNDPYLNHMTQPDTIVPDPGNPQDWNRYAYARNNPIRYNDPSGHWVDEGCGSLICNDTTSSGVQIISGTRVGNSNRNSDGNLVYSAPPGEDDEKKYDGPPDYCEENDWALPECYDVPPNFCELDDNFFHPWCNSWAGGGRGPDYRAFSAGTTIPTLWTGTLIGWHFTIVNDRYDQWYLGGGLDVGESIFGVDANWVAGYPPGRIKKPDELKDYISGVSLEYALSILAYFGGSTNIPFSDGSNFEFGAATPLLGGGFTVLFPLPNEP